MHFCDELTTNSIIQKCSTSLEFLCLSGNEGLFYIDKYNFPKLTQFFFGDQINESHESLISMYNIQSISKNLQSLYLGTTFLLHEIKNYNFTNLESLWITREYSLPTLCPKLSFLAITDVGFGFGDNEVSPEDPRKDAFNLEVIIFFYIWRDDCYKLWNSTKRLNFIYIH